MKNKVCISIIFIYIDIKKIIKGILFKIFINSGSYEGYFLDREAGNFFIYNDVIIWLYILYFKFDKN